MSEAGSFRGGVALITGGSQGLGYAVAQRLVAEGASGLLLAGRDGAKGEAAAASLRTPQCRAEFLAADLSHADACERVIADLDGSFGACHSFVNCAAI
ncbi:MAG: SDR family NAD(P)-dependent oxidoreductase, partial [Acidimicrobiaceae bacterium]|nr:SDR family NAD(P)-dependent oxidoreductase [Acidimicrobiaceae bacterium]